MAGIGQHRPQSDPGRPALSVVGGPTSALIRDIIAQFALQEFGHLRAIQNTPLRPPFDPYANDINYLIASYLIPYVGLTGYVGANPNLQSTTAKSLVAGLLGVESGQDAVIRTLLYERASLKVRPYPFTVAEFSTKISNLRNKLGKEGVKDEGLIVAGAEGRISGNVLSADKDSLAYARTPEEVLRIVYGSGQANVTGGFYPRGGNGRIARSYLPS
ncbi:UNVERIFIED_CONTAM: Desiccation-related protein PCC13-62 [Sesamum angustifolium]|uniref:Desiccation-related protein PCC13-62 n=1 Tax=Sesamum angustifolium TaxID=2727405 RepID=A0AAW2JD35_9LAMI